jgi:hypothetical protein
LPDNGLFFHPGKEGKDMCTFFTSYAKSAASTAMLVLIAAAGAFGAPPGVRLLSCDASGAVIEVTLPEWQINTVKLADREYTDLSLPGWSRLLEAGKPNVPRGGFLLALPPGATATLAVEVLRTRQLSTPPILPAPDPDRAGKNAAQDVFFADPAVYGRASLFPEDWAELGAPEQLRTYRVLPVRIFPVRSSGTRGVVEIAAEMRLTVKFHGGRKGRLISDPFMESLYRNTILNLQQARVWQEKPRPAGGSGIQPYGDYKVLVNRDGLYVITYDDLLAAGIEPSELDPATIKLYSKLAPQDTALQQNAVWVEGAWDGVFDPDDYILFYGKSPRGIPTYSDPYNVDNVYWLDWGGSPGLRTGVRSAPPGSAPPATLFKAYTRTEVDTMYDKFGYAPLSEPIDHWMWYRVDHLTRPQFSVLRSLPGLVVQSNLIYDLTVSLRGYTFNDSLFPDHRAVIRWNNHTLADTVWSYSVNGQTAFNGTFTIPPQVLTTTVPNEILFEAPEYALVFSNAYYVDWIRIGYWRNFNVSNDTLLFHHPQNMASGNIRYQLTGLQDEQVELWNLSRMERLVDFSYAQGSLAFQDSAADTTYYYVAGRRGWLSPVLVADEPSNWKNPNLGADYLMITHEDFYDGIAPLVSLYQSRGMRVQRVKVGDIYDEFSYGLKNPAAIFDFIQYAFYSYQEPPPSYVLLVGDASWDYKGQDALPYVDYVPTHAFNTYKWGETASDNWFVAVTGNEFHPDLHVGRLPVNNEEELNEIVQKIVGYAEPQHGIWRSDVIFSNGAFDPTFDAVVFDTTVENLIEEYLPSWYDPPRVYSTPSVGFEQYQGTSQDLINYINLGASMVNYMGHAGNQMWETLSQAEISLLTNGAKLPFVQAYSCFTGIFSNTKGFGEEFILHPGGGAIAYYANGGIGYLLTNAEMNDYMFQALFGDSANPYPEVTFGQAVTQAKWEYYTYFANIGNVIQTFVLFGDPASRFAYLVPDAADTLDIAPPAVTFTFGDTSGAPSTFHSGDFVKNPVQFQALIYDSTEIDFTTLTLELTHLADVEGNPVDTTWSWAWTEDSLAPPHFTFTFSPPDSQGHRFLLSYYNTLANGEWEFRLSVSDYLLHGPTIFNTNFRVGYDRLMLEQPLNHPNPFRDETDFTFILSQPAQVTIKIYTVSGKLIRTLRFTGNAGYNICAWDGLDQMGDPLSNGAYLYKIIAKNGDQQSEKIAKLAKVK